ncbi:ATP-binding protein [Streptomyces acidicola]|uniref:ATP-binding protein n=1 Tax=Streptomyces acidicola TaxID=2596892 RepID=UPI0037FDC3DF
MGISMSNFAASKISATCEGLLQARQFTRHHLARWGLEDVVDEVVAVVGELTGNAVRHAASGEGAWLALATGPRTVMCIVRDSSCQVPAPRVALQLATEGRGLSVVASLSSTWGWTVEDNGKAVWARIPI